MSARGNRAIASASDDEILRAVNSIISRETTMRGETIVTSRENSASVAGVDDTSLDAKDTCSGAKSREQELIEELTKELSLFSIEEQPVKYVVGMRE